MQQYGRACFMTRPCSSQVTPRSPPVSADGAGANTERREWREGLKAHIEQQRATAKQVWSGGDDGALGP